MDDYDCGELLDELLFPTPAPTDKSFTTPVPRATANELNHTGVRLPENIF